MTMTMTMTKQSSEAEKLTRKFKLAGRSPQDLGQALLQVMDHCQDEKRYMTQAEVLHARALILAGADMKTRSDRGGVEPLLYAVALNEPDLAALMIEKGADINTANKCGVTPTIMAAAFRQLDMIDTLLAVKPDMMLRDSDGRTAVENAVYFQRSYGIVAKLKRAEKQQLTLEKDIASGLASAKIITIRKFRPKK